MPPSYDWNKQGIRQRRRTVTSLVVAKDQEHSIYNAQQLPAF
jgi:hypothetical protein